MLDCPTASGPKFDRLVKVLPEYSLHSEVRFPLQD